MGAAYLLRDAADLTLFERNAYVGGHTRTLDVQVDNQTVAVDTGFIVYNVKNYPNLTQLFSELQVPVVKSDMSFGVSIANGWLEYASNGWKGIFGSVRNLVRPSYWKMLLDIMKFNREAPKYLDAPVSVSLEQCLDELGMGDWFRRYYFLPMGGSIWSCPVDQMLKFPACSLIRFFQNHGLLTIADHPQWYTVLGGAREYVRRIMESMGNDFSIRPGAVRIARDVEKNHVQIEDEQGQVFIFDEVIIATHPDEALALIENPSSDEEQVLSAFRYQPNDVVLHTDVNFMPKRRSAWASWVYRSDARVDESPAVSLSYWMNNLQNLGTDVPVIVTLNPSTMPDEACILDKHRFDHPVFDEQAVQAQENIMQIQGKSGLWFCGAYQRNGFHEDGLWSAVRVVRSMGVEVPWK